MPPSMTAGPHFERYGIVGRSRAIADVIRRIDLVSATRSTVLITGETGTGKELVARAVHHRSAQRDMPFIKVNCAAIPETLLESELFGHVKGAFTDATGTRRGKFSLADRGSIFLDEIATMSAGLQAKLLRVLQEREIEPLGGERTEHGTSASSRRPTATCVSSCTRDCSRTTSTIACT
jgi:transcriptional regulator with GAF, ATPase, and Fis domain